MFYYKDSEKQMKLGKLITELESIEDKTKEVIFDFGYFIPNDFISWRGSYDLLSLTYVPVFEAPERTTVEILLKKAKDSVDKEFYGYKGGEYVMSEYSPIWISNYGHSNSTGLLSVSEKKYNVVLNTFYCEYGS